MDERIGVRASREPKVSGMRSVNSSSNTRQRQGNLARNPWSNQTPKSPSLQKATGIENQLRYALLRKGINFIEQASIGPWSIDFLLPDYMACVEADGEFWHSSTKAKMKDRRKDAWLQSKGYMVFHFDGKEITQDADYCVNRMMKSLENNVNLIAEKIQAVENEDEEWYDENIVNTSQESVKEDQEYEDWLNSKKF